MRNNKLEIALKEISEDKDFIRGIFSGIPESWKQEKMLSFIEYGKDVGDDFSRSDMVALMLILMTEKKTD